MTTGSLFDGRTASPADDPRLKTQLAKVRECLRRHLGEWMTIRQIGTETGLRHSASISARIRDLRKKKFGSFNIEERRAVNAETTGLFEYRMAGQEGTGVPDRVICPNCGHQIAKEE